jgi:hypothetical protein
MPHIHILPDDLNDDAHFVNVGVRLGMTPDALEMPKVDEHVDLVAGYEVMSVRPTQHDGVPATLITLGDSTGGREVGILRVRNDATRDAQLEVVRLFADSDEKASWIKAQTEQPGTDEIKTIELDVTDEGWGDELDESTPFPLNVMMAMTAGSGITYRIVQLRGPGGGWPVIAFTGKDRELRKMLMNHYGAGAPESDSVAFYMGEED